MKYIGIDVHSRTCVFAVLDKRGRILERRQTETNEGEILSFVRSIKGRISLVFEEGELSQWMYLLLKDEVETLVVCQPTGLKGPKTDVLDAVEIADLLRVGRLKSVFHADSMLMTLRVLMSGYNDLISELNRTKNRYKALYRRLSIPTNVSKFYESEEMLGLLAEHKQHYYVASGLFKRITLLEEQRQEYKHEFELNVDNYKDIKLLTSIPGIGPVRANQIVATVVSPYRFANKYKFYSYSMLVSHNRISGGKLYGKRKAHGRSELKELFISAVWNSLKSNNAFRRRYDKLLATGKDSKAVRNNVARMIAGTVLAVWKTRTKYNDRYKEVTQQAHQNCHSGA
jgi:transposase